MNGNFDEQGEQGLRHALWSVRRFLPELVLIGGWVPYIYRRYGGFSEWGSGLSGTTELDLLVAPKDHADDGGTLADALRLAGFGPRAEGAVWESPDPAARIEFMTIHRGTAANLGRVVPLHHAGVGAIALRDLTLLGEFTTTVQLPVALVEGALQSVDLRVPTLGAYALNKGLTFPYRPAEPGEGASPRSGKDVLYLRDLMAAGDEVVDQISGDIAAIRSGGYETDVERARSNVYLLLHGELRRHIARAAEILREREGTHQTEAESNVAGHLTDFFELL
jgi:hypothetical protein